MLWVEGGRWQAVKPIVKGLADLRNGDLRILGLAYFQDSGGYAWSYQQSLEAWSHLLVTGSAGMGFPRFRSLLSCLRRQDPYTGTHLNDQSQAALFALFPRLAGSRQVLELLRRADSAPWDRGRR